MRARSRRSNRSGAGSPTRGGSDASAALTGARFGNLVAVCPDESINVPVPVLILVEAQAGGTVLSIDSAAATLIIAASADASEVGFASSQATTASPLIIPSKTHATVQVVTHLICNNGPGDPGRFNEWSGRVTFNTSAGVFTVETADRLRVNIP